MKLFLPILVGLSATPVVAQESRGADAHEHGVGSLNIAVDGDTVVMELNAPGADIVGFEYAAESDADREAIGNALAILVRPQELFALPEGAGCTVTRSFAELVGGDIHEHGEYASDSEHDHDAEHDHDEEHEHAGQDHDDEPAPDDEDRHAEFHAEYELSCTDSGAISEIDFGYFERIENAMELEVQVVTGSGAQAFEVLRDDPTLDLSGLF